MLGVSSQKTNMKISRIVSGSIYLGGQAWAIVHFESKEIFISVVGLAVPVCMIWYPNEINDYTIGLFGEGGQIDSPTPPVMISGFGWVCLLGFVVFTRIKVFQ